MIVSSRFLALFTERIPLNVRRWNELNSPIRRPLSGDIKSAECLLEILMPTASHPTVTIYMAKNYMAKNYTSQSHIHPYPRRFLTCDRTSQTRGTASCAEVSTMLFASNVTSWLGFEHVYVIGCVQLLPRSGIGPDALLAYRMMRSYVLPDGALLPARMAGEGMESLV